MTFFEYHNAGNQEAQEMQALAFLLAQDSVGKAKNGVLVGLGVTQTPTASGSIIVGAGSGVVQAATLDGASLVGDVQDTTIDVFTGSPVGGLPRIDRVVADRATGSIRVIVGVPNATPAAPTVPSSALPLARLTHAAGATAISTAEITDERVFTKLNVPAPTTWTAITPVYTNTLGETLSIGNGAISGRWRVSDTGAGQMATFQGSLVRGSTTNVGTGGSWAIQLPTAAVDNSAIGIGSQTIGSVEKQLLVTLPSSSLLAFCDTAGARISPTNPGGGAAAQAGHVYKWSINYFLP